MADVIESRSRAHSPISYAESIRASMGKVEGYPVSQARMIRPYFHPFLLMLHLGFASHRPLLHDRREGKGGLRGGLHEDDASLQHGSGTSCCPHNADLEMWRQRDEARMANATNLLTIVTEFVAFHFPA